MLKAIVDVIENGDIISHSSNYEGKGYDRYIIAAKGLIDGKQAYIGVVIKTYPNNYKANGKFYLHEAVIIETDSPIMTAPQLSVDTVSESVPKYSISPDGSVVNKNLVETDRAYISAVENGDTETAQKMIKRQQGSTCKGIFGLGMSLY